MLLSTDFLIFFLQIVLKRVSNLQQKYLGSYRKLEILFLTLCDICEYGLFVGFFRGGGVLFCDFFSYCFCNKNCMTYV